MRKEKIKRNNKIWCCLIFETLFLTILYLCFVGQYKGFFLSEDELGYWGSAAKLAGLDWGNVLEGTSYYSYGYSLVLALLLKLPIKPLYIYRVAVGLNTIYILISFYIAFYVLTHLFPNKSKYYISLACMVGLCYSSYVTQSALSWPELFLVMILWLIILQVYLLCEKITVLRLVIFILEIMYIYMIHMRTLSVLFAGVLLLLVLGLRNEKMRKWIIIALISGILLFILSNVIKNIIQLYVYKVEATANIGNDYKSVLSGKLDILTIWGLILSALGQLYGVVASSYGIVLVGIVLALMNGWELWKSNNKQAYLFFYTVVVFLAAWFISAFFLKGVSAGRFDFFFYSRYIDNAISFFIILGLIELLSGFDKRRWMTIIGVLVTLFAITAIAVSYRARTYGMPSNYYQGVCAPGTYMWYKAFGVSMFRITGTVLLVMGLVYLLMKLGDIKKIFFAKIGALLILLVLWIVAGRLVVRDQILPYENTQIADLAYSDELFELINNQNCSVAFFSTKPHSIRGSVQFYIKDTPIRYIRDWDSVIANKPDILIVDREETLLLPVEIGRYELIYCIGEMTVWKNMDCAKHDFEDEMELLGYSYYDLNNENGNYEVYGPYVTLPSGKYRVTYELIIDEANKRLDEYELGFVDVFSTEQVYAIESCTNVNKSYTLEFELPEKTKEMEFRFYKNKGNNSRIKRIIVEIMR